MKNIAIVEDEPSAAETLRKYLDSFSKETGDEFNVSCFSDPILFLTNYTANYDIVFMDIELPNMNGLKAAQKLREYDKNVVLIFVTNMAQYAVKGYEVEAFDYIVKPISYYNFALKLKRALARIKITKNTTVNVKTEDGLICLDASQIKYVEIIKHKIIYHTVNKNYLAYGTLKKIEDILAPVGFCRCNSCFLINLRYVTAIRDYVAVLSDGEELQISHPKKKEFVKALNDYLGGGKF